MHAQLQHGKECGGRGMGRFRTVYSVMLDVVANQTLHLRSERIRSASLRAQEERPILAKTTEIAASWMFNSGEMLWRIARMLHALAWKAAVRLGIRDLAFGKREFEATDGTRFSVRPFRKGDAADCSDMIRTAYLRRMLRMDDEKRESFLSGTSDKFILRRARRQDWFVAECDGRVVGAIGLVRFAWYGGDLTSFCVDEDFQRRGIGTVLGAAYVMHKRREGLDYLSAHCFEPSRRILQAHGFCYWGVDGEYCGEPIHDMSAVLGTEVLLLVQGELAGRCGHS